jgi:hypothetical protein
VRVVKALVRADAPLVALDGQDGRGLGQDAQRDDAGQGAQRQGPRRLPRGSGAGGMGLGSDRFLKVGSPS